MLREYNSAVRMREVIEKIATRIVNRERPSDKIGRIVDIDRASGLAWVVYPGDETTSLRVRIYPGRQPQASDRFTGEGLGAIVRVSGPIGARYVAEVLSDAGHFQTPRFYQPRFASAGMMESSLLAYFPLRTSDVPPRDGVTRYYTAVLNMPLAAATVEIRTEVVLDTGRAYHQTDSFRFDDSAAKGVDVAATTVNTTSAGMGLSYYYNLYDGTLDGMSPGSLSLTLAQSLSTTGTQVAVRSNIMMSVFGMDPNLLRIVDGTSLDA